MEDILKEHADYLLFLAPGESGSCYTECDNFMEALKIHAKQNDGYAEVFSFDTAEERTAFIRGYENGVGMADEGFWIKYNQ